MEDSSPLSILLQMGNESDKPGTYFQKLPVQLISIIH